MNNSAIFATKSRGQSAARLTSAQRKEILRLLRLAEFDTRTVTFMHRRLGVAEHEIGGSVDAWLDAQTVANASALIAKLRDIVGVEDEED